MSKAFEAIEINSNTIKAVSEKYNIPKEIIGSIILKEQYTQSLPDQLAMATSEIGDGFPDSWMNSDNKLSEIFRKVFGEHSTGYGAIFATTCMGRIFRARSC